MPTRLTLVLLATLLAGCGNATTLPDDTAEVRPGTRTTEGVNSPEHLNSPYVVLISFDGFHPSYIDRVETPALDRMMTEGTRAEALIPVFPTKTFPNHYSIATGMYPAAHGIVSNSFYDPERNETYALGQESVLDGTWYAGEPIWLSAETQGMVAASYFWVGSEAPIHGLQPTIWKPYDGRVPNEARVDSVLTWLDFPAENRPHMITLYFSEVDNAGHRHGPDAPQVDEAVRNVDAALGRLLDGIDNLPIADQVYVVLVSDHGMASYQPEDAVALESFIEMDGVIVGDSGPVASLHVPGGAEQAIEIRDQLNAGLEHGRAYLADETPAEYNYRDNPRIGDVIVIMEEGHQIRPQERMPRYSGGTHGWSPALESMHGIFLARGPGIRAGHAVEAFEVIHVYPLLTEILNLTPGPDVDGYFGYVGGMIME